MARLSSHIGQQPAARAAITAHAADNTKALCRRFFTLRSMFLFRCRPADPSWPGLRKHDTRSIREEKVSRMRVSRMLCEPWFIPTQPRMGLAAHSRAVSASEPPEERFLNMKPRQGRWRSSLASKGSIAPPGLRVIRVSSPGVPFGHRPAMRRRPLRGREGDASTRELSDTLVSSGEPKVHASVGYSAIRNQVAGTARGRSFTVSAGPPRGRSSRWPR
jgi:hypothetical protein